MKDNKIIKPFLVLAVLLCTTLTSNGTIATDAKLQYNKGIDYYQLGQFEESANVSKMRLSLTQIILMHTTI